MPPVRSRIVLPWAIVAVAFLAAVGGIFVANESFYRDHASYFSGISSPPIGALRSAPVRLEVHFSNGAKRAFRGSAAGGLTALAALRASGEAGNFSVVTDERGEIVEIARVRNQRLRRWTFTVNGQAQGELAGHVWLKGGDRVVYWYQETKRN